jgi:hypothetical protein
MITFHNTHKQFVDNPEMTFKFYNNKIINRDGLIDYRDEHGAEKHVRDLEYIIYYLLTNNDIRLIINQIKQIKLPHVIRNITCDIQYKRYDGGILYNYG